MSNIINKTDVSIKSITDTILNISSTDGAGSFIDMVLDKFPKSKGVKAYTIACTILCNGTIEVENGTARMSMVVGAEELLDVLPNVKKALRNKRRCIYTHVCVSDADYYDEMYMDIRHGHGIIPLKYFIDTGWSLPYHQTTKRIKSI